MLNKFFEKCVNFLCTNLFLIAKNSQDFFRNLNSWTSTKNSKCQNWYKYDISRTVIGHNGTQGTKIYLYS